MSKKSRRRNRKILGALAALGGAAMLANRRRNASIETNEAKEAGFDIPAVKSKSIYTDPIMKGGKGVKAAKVGGFPRLKVTDRGNVIRDGVDTGVGNMKTKFVGGDGKIFQGGKQVGESGVTSPGISVRDDGSIMSKGVLYKDRSSYMNRNKMPGNLSRDMGIKRTPVIDDSFFSGAMAKDGGKI